MNTIKLAVAFASILAASTVACSSAPGEDTGSSEDMATADIDHMFKRPDGKFDVWCSNGTREAGVTVEQIRNDQVCGGPASGGGAAQCIAATVPAAAAWKAPAAPSTHCTAADIQALGAASGAGIKAMRDAVAANNVPCAECIFTDEAGPSWGPIVTSDGHTKGRINWSACFARAPLGSEACGETFNKHTSCVAEMCSTCADADRDACFSDAATDAAKCGQYDLDAACGGSFQAVDAECPDPIAMIKINCGG